MYPSSAKIEVLKSRSNGLTLTQLCAEFPNVKRRTIAAWIQGTHVDSRSDRFKSKERKIQRDADDVRRADNQFEIFKSDPLFTAGISLYLGEGSKTGALRLGNSDPRALLIWKKWVERYEPDSSFVLDVVVHETSQINPSCAFWSNVLGLPVTYVGINNPRPCSKTKRRIEHGTAIIRSLKGVRPLVRMLRYIDLYASEIKK